MDINNVICQTPPMPTKVYKCRLCNCQTNRKCNIKRHQGVLHPDYNSLKIEPETIKQPTKRYRCRMCEYQSDKMWMIKRHQRLRHQENPSEELILPTQRYICSMCDYQSDKMWMVKRHEKLRHQKNNSLKNMTQSNLTHLKLNNNIVMIIL